jgi:hypothetical protein
MFCQPKNLVLLMILLASTTYAIGQKNIVLSENLEKNAEKLPVKMGSQGFGKMWKFRFGDYAVISSKLGWTTENAKSNFWNTKTESKTTEKFSFFLTNKAGDTAKVNAAHNIVVESLQSFPLTEHISIGTDALVSESNNFSAFITINSDSTETWALLMNLLKSPADGVKGEAYLTNGERTIVIVSASSNKNGEDKRSMPALGYELLEKNNAVSALQYYGGGALGMNKNIVWLENNNTDRMKLILSAAMSALLQIKATSPM